MYVYRGMFETARGIVVRFILFEGSRYDNGRLSNLLDRIWKKYGVGKGDIVRIMGHEFAFAAGENVITPFAYENHNVAADFGPLYTGFIGEA